jgi:hypothetical protein
MAGLTFPLTFPLVFDPGASSLSRSISIYVDSTFGAENTTFLEERIRRAVRVSGTSAETNSGTVTVGTREDNLTVQIGSGGTNTTSISIVVDETVSVALWAKLVEIIVRIVRTSQSVFTMTTNDGFLEGSRSDSCRFTIT